MSLLFIRIYHQIKPYFTRIYHKMSDVTRSHHLIFVRYHETHQWLEQFLLRACPPPSHVCACPPPSDDCHQLRRSHWPPPVQCNTGHCYIHVYRLYQLQQCTTLVPLLHVWCANAPYVSVLYWLHSCNWYSLHTYMYVRRLCRLYQLQQCNTLVPLVTVTSMMCHWSQLYLCNNDVPKPQYFMHYIVLKEWKRRRVMKARIWTKMSTRIERLVADNSKWNGHTRSPSFHRFLSQLHLLHRFSLFDLCYSILLSFPAFSSIRVLRCSIGFSFLCHHYTDCTTPKLFRIAREDL